jgi:hypothetical protein
MTSFWYVSHKIFYFEFMKLIFIHKKYYYYYDD